jgi:hypothetical protein
MGGFEKIAVIPMGDNLVLLQAVNTEVIEEAERKQENWWRGLFKLVKRWSPNRLASKRRV